MNFFDIPPRLSAYPFQKGMADAVGYLIDFQLVWIFLGKVVILWELWGFRRRIEEGSKKGRRREEVGN